jgi:Kef-type K+ transport system membrane component KefB
MHTERVGEFFILLGGLFFIGLLVSSLARILAIPRVTLLLLSGVALSPVGFDLLSIIPEGWLSFIADFTLLIIGYLLGARLTPEFIHQYAKGVLISSTIITLVTSAVVTLGLIALGVNLYVSLILGALAAATDPAAMVDVLHQRNSVGHFGKTLEGIVAMDDVLGLLVFSVALTVVGYIEQGNGSLKPLLNMLYEVGGAILLGSVAGYITAKLLNAKKQTQPVIVESLAFILLLGGVTKYFDVSFLLAAMVMGAVVVNVADKAADHLHEIEEIEQPFLVLFFIMAGASLSLDAGAIIIQLVVFFVLLRIVGRYLGGLAIPAKYTLPHTRHIIGVTLLPQAGVAMGMALVASNQFPQIANVVIPVAISATVIFEVLGPVMTAKCLDFEAQNNRSAEIDQ